MTVVRPAAGNEAAAVAAVAARTFALACPPDAPADNITAYIEAHLTEARFADEIANPWRRVTVAVSDEQIVGYALLVLEPPTADIAAQLTAPPAAQLSKIYVDPDRQGGSVARPLLDAAVDDARGTGNAGLWLTTNEANLRAQRFYEKNGFVRVGTTRFQLGDRLENDFVYERRL